MLPVAGKGFDRAEAHALLLNLEETLEDRNPGALKQASPALSPISVDLHGSI